MRDGIYNFSEIGKLNKVLLHRIGREVEGLVPDNFQRLLFDDIPYLKVAQAEHDMFANVLRDNGVEVIYYVQETAKALKSDSIRRDFIWDFINMSHVNSIELKEGIFEFLFGLDPVSLVEKVIEGVRKSDVPGVCRSSIADLLISGDEFYMEPMPNLYFTRDPGCCIGEGLSIHHMGTLARRREALLLEYMYRYNRDFALESDCLWYDYNMNHSIEGGDILILNSKTVAVGLSSRTSAYAIEQFALNLLGFSPFERILVFDIPKCRAFMHLDTVFTMVDYDKFTIHHEIEGPLNLFEITLDKSGSPRVCSMTESLKEVLMRVLNLPSVKLIRCGGNDPMAGQREQWNDGSNTLCIAPGRVITYERNYLTNELLAKEGIDVLTIPSSELSRGRGGPRCMSCPVNRDDL